MDKNKFWSIIAETLSVSAGSFDAQEKALRDALFALPIEENEAFARMFHQFSRDAYRWDIWCAGYLVDGGCSDDGFMDFRSWLISRGRQAYESALLDPDSLADVDPGEDYFFEGFQYVRWQVYTERTGVKLTGFPPHPRAPGKPDWKFDWNDSSEMSRRLPRLWKKIKG